MPGKLYVIGIGPGAPDHLTPAARAAIEASDIVVGYKTYLDLIVDLLPGKTLRSSGMRKEVERCREALELAAGGGTVALISSGDAGIYGMAGLVLELAEKDSGTQHAAAPQDVAIEVVPGVSAVQAAAARLGAPLMHDFSVISLSDLLTPWTLIRRRLAAAAAADFVIALYNPASGTRLSQISEAREILLCHRSRETPVGIVRNACRRDETVTVTTLGSLLDHTVDMLSLAIVGNSATFVDRAGRMVTPRGYQIGSRFNVQGSENPNRPRLTSEIGGVPGGARALFIGGTGSDVGKSVIAAGLCRVLRRRGFSVAPFKAQNMALNSAVTPEGGEIGRAQALQAAACGLDPHTDMNPVLLKPNSETGSQVIVQGRPVGNMTVGEYHRYKAEASVRVKESFARLAAAHDVVVMEGAGSIAEINLKAHDITNLRAAARAAAPVLLVADIDRGGVFAAIVGTLELLEPEEKKQVAGVIINRFRGDPGLLRSGIEAVEGRTGVPVLGVVSWIDLRLPEEDSVALVRKGKTRRDGAVRIGVVRLPRISNYSDFDALEQEPGVDLRYLGTPEEVDGLDLVVLPGTKSTLSDLQWLREKGFFRVIHDFHVAGGRVAGICGGYQMLGRTIADPDRVESGIADAEGLGLLDVTTVLKPVKQTHQVEAVPLPAAGALGLAGGERAGGYEIHMGETHCGPLCRPLLRITLRSGRRVDLEDGAVSADGRVFGTYLHGFFDNPAVRGPLLDLLGSQRGIPPSGTLALPTLENELDRLADHLEANLDIPSILDLLGPKRVGAR
jgi:adenosylcobyric acid synthase